MHDRNGTPGWKSAGHLPLAHSGKSKLSQNFTTLHRTNGYVLYPQNAVGSTHPKYHAKTAHKDGLCMVQRIVRS